jgi:hypothetical protein
VTLVPDKLSIYQDLAARRLAFIEFLPVCLHLTNHLGQTGLDLAIRVRITHKLSFSEIESALEWRRNHGRKGRKNMSTFTVIAASALTQS